MKIRNVALAAGIAAIMSGCATQEEISEVEAARAVVAQVEASPMASRAAANVNDARNALNRAEEAMEDGDDVHTIKHHAYVATRQAQIANEKILTAQAEEEIKKAESERQTVIANARERDAQQAMSAAEEARLRAMSAEERAEQLAQEREKLAKQLQDLKDLNARQTERGLVLTLGDVLFDVDQSTLKPGAMSTMDRLATFLKEQNERGVIVEGHTDSTGSAEYNMQLSQRRADAVRTALVDRGVSRSQIEALGKGKDMPVASNDSPGGRQQNRRVEIIIPNEGTAGSAVARDAD